MGNILSKGNLESYLNNVKWPWPPDSLIYECFPVLAVRNYLTTAEDEEFPLLWTPGRHLQVGVVVATAVLKGWQAFRPKTAEEIRPALERCVPGAVMKFQTRMSELGIYRILDLRKNSKGTDIALIEMSAAVAKVSACKPGKTPMLGSKILHLFFPECFPVWDTGVVERAIKSSRGSDEMCLSDALTKTLAKRAHHQGASKYCAYVQLMLRDLADTQDDEYVRLRDMLISHCVRANGHSLLPEMIEDNVYDLSPILFELCLIGRGLPPSQGGSRCQG